MPSRLQRGQKFPFSDVSLPFSSPSLAPKWFSFKEEGEGRGERKGPIQEKRGSLGEIGCCPNYTFKKKLEKMSVVPCLFFAVYYNSVKEIKSCYIWHIPPLPLLLI